jgi:hypothetical protein
MPVFLRMWFGKDLLIIKVKEMTEKKSDFRRFCETMWVITKYDVLPLLIGAGLFTAFVLKLKDAKDKETLSQQERSAVKTEFLQKQR